jgi:hypothetical protein
MIKSTSPSASGWLASQTDTTSMQAGRLRYGLVVFTVTCGCCDVRDNAMVQVADHITKAVFEWKSIIDKRLKPTIVPTGNIGISWGSKI